MNTQKKKRRMLIPLAISAVSIILFLIAGIAIWKLNTYSLILSVSDETIVLEYGVDELPEITALCKGSLINKKGEPVETTMEGELDLTKLGTYHITYKAVYKGMTLREDKTIIVQDTLPPSIELVSDPEHFTSPVGSYEEEGFTATDNFDGDLTDQVIRTEENGIVTYTVSDSSGNQAVAERTIIYKDVVSPTITLAGDKELLWTIGKDFSDPGFTASDDVDGDLTSAVITEGKVDGHKKGNYILTYQVKDSSDNICEIQRTVKVGDFTAPVLKLKGKKDTYIKIGTNYKDPGFTASDNIDGNLTPKVTIEGKVDTSKMGSNKITYKVTDTSGNSTSVTRTVYVYKKQAQADTITPGGKVIYLTFDDGPGKYTSQLLDILDKYGVKATFFVTNQFPSYQHLIGEAHRRGHTIALHTYSHKYQDIYSSEEAYYKDLELIHNICVKQTGVTPTIVRFPGGTNNGISRKYCKGIMSSLAKNLSYHGYFYTDWNVDSMDAGGATTADKVAANVIAGIKKHTVSNVLQHDIKKYSVEAVDQIIFWGLENGYTFLPMTDTSPMIHFKPTN